MKTVIHYIGGSYLPITQTWIYEQIRSLKEYQPTVYALETRNLDMYPTERIRSLELKDGLGNLTTLLNKGWNRLFNFYPSCVFFFIEDRPGLVHAHFGPSGYSLLSFKRIFKFSLITSFYGYDLWRLPHQDSKWKSRYERLFEEGDGFLVEGHHMKSHAMELGCSEEKIIVQHLGVDLNRIKFLPRRPEASGRIGVLIAGRFREKKGIPYGIEAFGRVRRAYSQLQLDLTIIGDSNGAPEEEKEKEKILTTIKKHRLNHCVRMMGYQPHSVFLREVERHHIFLSPSVHASNGDSEGGVPVSLIEVSASGMPILSTNHCDIPEVIVDRQSGYLAPERDVCALTEGLEFLVSNPHMWERMGEQGRQHIEKHYNIARQTDRLEEIYDMIAKRS